jgi:hypothetical protein
MSPVVRPPLRLHPALAIAIIVGCLGGIIYALWPIFALVGQWLAVIALLLSFRYWPPMFRLVKSMPVPHRLVFGLILGAMILGHLTIRPTRYFPFMPWYIFTGVSNADQVTCQEFIATTVSGRKVRLLVEQLFPSVVQIYPLDDKNRFPPGSVDHLTHVLAKAYNTQHGDDPVLQVDLMLMTVQLHPSTTESRSQPPCELIKHYDVSLDQ